MGFDLINASTLNFKKNMKKRTKCKLTEKCNRSNSSKDWRNFDGNGQGCKCIKRFVLLSQEAMGIEFSIYDLEETNWS